MQASNYLEACFLSILTFIYANKATSKIICALEKENMIFDLVLLIWHSNRNFV